MSATFAPTRQAPTTARLIAAAALTALAAAPAFAQPGHVTDEAAMMTGLNGYKVSPVLTIGEAINGYTAPGVLDGLGVYDQGTSIRVLANHELNPGKGYAYSLDNGTQLTGARVSYFDINKSDRSITGAGLAYGSVYDRDGNLVSNPAQINETGNAIDGFARFCSSHSFNAGEYGFVDDIYFAGEETGKPFHPHGGTEWAMNVGSREVWAAPALGRGAWENVTALDSGRDDKVAILLGDDTQSAPLYLYIGDKDAVGDGSFLDRNGLAQGQLYAWKADSGDIDPEGFKGTGSQRTGRFVALPDTFRPDLAGTPGYDEDGYADIDTLQAIADAQGAFSFSRPEDVHTNPANGTQAALASTGRENLFPSDAFGSTYIIDFDFESLDNGEIGGDIRILFDGDDTGNQDAGLRSPDNLVWSADGHIYVQEDASTDLFGSSGDLANDASIWRIDPDTGEIVQIAEMDRNAIPEMYFSLDDAGEPLSTPGQLGEWESSGIIDVSELFDLLPGSLFLADVQAHSLEGGIIDELNLDEGGQLIFIEKIGSPNVIPTPAAAPAGLLLLAGLTLRRRRRNA